LVAEQSILHEEVRPAARKVAESGSQEGIVRWGGQVMEELIRERKEKGDER
jgi:hypothetical protein